VNSSPQRRHAFSLGAGLWAAIGVGVGALVRNQAALIGICAWLLFVEGLLAGDTGGLGEIGRFLPGSAASAISGQDPGTLLAPAVGLVVLAAYSVTAALAGAYVTSRRGVRRSSVLRRERRADELLAVPGADLGERLRAEERLIGGRQLEGARGLPAFAEEPFDTRRSEEQEEPSLC
jgi:hypothetical protein